MFDAKDLLGRMMQAGMSGSAPDRVSHAMGPRGLGHSGSPLGALLGGLLGRGGAQSGGLGGGWVRAASPISRSGPRICWVRERIRPQHAAGQET
ncbi:MAG: hypothetical protein ACM30D_02925, partial [Hyphomicrobiales bacterium]